MKVQHTFGRLLTLRMECHIFKGMFRWNHEKNQKLIAERDISFDEIVQAVLDGLVVDDSPHPNRDKYSNQRIMTICLREYVYLVPYVIDGNDFFLKTIIPSRKALKKQTGDQK